MRLAGLYVDFEYRYFLDILQIFEFQKNTFVGIYRLSSGI